MARELLMPKLGLTMTEGLLAEWVVQPGDTYEQDDCLYIVETEKVTNEILADRAGTFLEATVAVGETVPVGAVVGRVDDGSQSDAAPAPEAASDTAASSAAVANDASQPAAGTPTPAVAAASSPSSSPQGERIVASPLARRLAKEQGVDLASITGTGPGGRIVARDIHAAGKAVATAKAPAAEPQTVASSQAGDASRPQAGYTLLQPTRMQTTIAQRLTQSKQQAPHFYLTLDADVSALLELRKALNAQRKARNVKTFTINDFIVKAVVAAMRDQPEINRVWAAEGIKQFHQVNVGVAINTEQGLVAPTVTGLDTSSLADVSSRVRHVVERAREQALRPDDMAEAAITVSNAGMHNVTYMTSIINWGQTLILGVGAIRPVFRPDEAGQPELRQEMGLVLSADHRITDGVQGLEFLNRIVDFLEQPLSLLAE